MDIIIKEINVSESDKIEEFDRTKNDIIRFLKTRYYFLNRNTKKRNKMKTSLNMNVSTDITIDLVKMTYLKLFGKPENDIYDEEKMKIIKKHLKQKNLI